MRPLIAQLLAAPSRLAATALSSVARRKPEGARAGQPADPFDRLPAMVAAERRREALRRMRTAG